MHDTQAMTRQQQRITGGHLAHRSRGVTLQYGYSFKSKNNCCSVYMNTTFYGHTLNINGLLNLDRNDTHIHNIDAKRCKVDNDSATYLWHCRLGHIGVKRMKKDRKSVV